jgi:hypothetical protein
MCAEENTKVVTVDGENYIMRSFVLCTPDLIFKE